MLRVLLQNPVEARIQDSRSAWGRALSSWGSFIAHLVDQIGLVSYAPTRPLVDRTSDPQGSRIIHGRPSTWLTAIGGHYCPPSWHIRDSAWSASGKRNYSFCEESSCSFRSFSILSNCSLIISAWLFWVFRITSHNPRSWSSSGRVCNWDSLNVLKNTSSH